MSSITREVQDTCAVSNKVNANPRSKTLILAATRVSEAIELLTMIAAFYDDGASAHIASVPGIYPWSSRTSSSPQP